MIEMMVHLFIIGLRKRWLNFSFILTKVENLVISNEKLRPPLPPFQQWQKWHILLLAQIHRRLILGRGVLVALFIPTMIVDCKLDHT